MLLHNKNIKKNAFIHLMCNRIIKFEMIIIKKLINQFCKRACVTLHHSRDLVRQYVQSFKDSYGYFINNSFLMFTFSSLLHHFILFNPSSTSPFSMRTSHKRRELEGGLIIIINNRSTKKNTERGTSRSNSGQGTEPHSPLHW